MFSRTTFLDVATAVSAVLWPRVCPAVSLHARSLMGARISSHHKAFVTQIRGENINYRAKTGGSATSIENAHANTRWLLQYTGAVLLYLGSQGGVVAERLSFEESKASEAPLAFFCSPFGGRNDNTPIEEERVLLRPRTLA